MKLPKLTNPTFLTLLQNVGLLVLIALTIWLTLSPLPLVALVLMKDLPTLTLDYYAIDAGLAGGNEEEADEDDDEPNIGFTARM